MYSEILKRVDSETSEISERKILEYFDLNYESRLENNKYLTTSWKKYNDLITSNKLNLFYLNRNHIAVVSL